MASALEWLEAPSLDPVATAVPSAPGRSGECYDGLLARTPDGGLAPVDLLAGPEGRAGTLRDAVPPGAALARCTAVWVHTGRLCPDRPDVVVEAGQRPHTAVAVHRQHLAVTDVVHLGGVPTTTPVRTAVDLLCFAAEPVAVAGTCALLLAGLEGPLVREALNRPGRRAPVRRAVALLAVAVDAAGRRRP